MQPSFVQQLAAFHKAAQKAQEDEGRASEYFRRKTKEKIERRQAGVPARPKRKFEENCERIVAVLKEYPDGLRRVDLGKRAGIAPDRLSLFFEPLLDAGRIYKQEGTHIWRAVQEQ